MTRPCPNLLCAQDPSQGWQWGCEVQQAPVNDATAREVPPSSGGHTKRHPRNPLFYSKASLPGSRTYGNEATPAATSTPLVEEEEEKEEAPSTPQRQFQTPPHTQRQWPSSIRKENRRKKDAKVLASLKWE